MVRDDIRKNVFQAVAMCAEMDPELEGALLVGVVAVAEWEHPIMGRLLLAVDSNADYERLPSWQAVGYLSRCAALMIHND